MIYNRRLAHCYYCGALIEPSYGTPLRRAGNIHFRHLECTRPFHPRPEPSGPRHSGDVRLLLTTYLRVPSP